MSWAVHQFVSWWTQRWLDREKNRRWHRKRDKKFMCKSSSRILLIPEGWTKKICPITLQFFYQLKCNHIYCWVWNLNTSLVLNVSVALCEKWSDIRYLAKLISVIYYSLIRQKFLYGYISLMFRHLTFKNLNWCWMFILPLCCQISNCVSNLLFFFLFAVVFQMHVLSQWQRYCLYLLLFCQFPRDLFRYSGLSFNQPQFN